jgi:ribosomal-protein-alanine N-acetyltransferase
MDFRRAIPDDAPGIAALEEAIFPDAWDYRSVMDLITTEGAMCFTASEGGRVIAYVIGRLIAPEGEIYRVAVDEAYRKRGIAYRLLDYAVKTSRGKGLESIFLEVRSMNTPAINLYRAYGFSEVGRRKGYYRNPTDDAIVMLKVSRADIYEL